MEQASEMQCLLEQPLHAAAAEHTSNVKESAQIAKLGAISFGHCARPMSSTWATAESPT